MTRSLVISGHRPHPYRTCRTQYHSRCWIRRRWASRPISLTRSRRKPSSSGRRRKTWRPRPQSPSHAQALLWMRSHHYHTDDTEVCHRPVHTHFHKSKPTYPITIIITTTSENHNARRGFAGEVVALVRKDEAVLENRPHASGSPCQTQLGTGYGNVGRRMTSYCGRGVLAFWRWGVSIPPVHMSLIRLYITSISAVNFFILRVSFECHRRCDLREAVASAMS